MLKLTPLLAGLFLMFACSPIALAEIQTRSIDYRDDGVRFRGYLAMPQDVRGERPGVLIMHEWWGLNDYIKQRADALAELGYIAFAADLYGDGRTTDDPKQAAAWAGELRNNRRLLRDRAEAAFDVLDDLEHVDDDRLAVIGYCFGGTAAVELGYEEDDVRGVVSFHGGPLPALPADDDIAAQFLILHGNADPLVSDDDLKAFAEPLDERGVTYRIVRYEGAKHAFTNPAADKLGDASVGYHPAAAEQAWQEMQTFLRQRLGPVDGAHNGGP